VAPYNNHPATLIIQNNLSSGRLHLQHFIIMPISIRQASVDDAPALSRICLLTADAGKSAEDLHNFPELPGLLWAVPYVHLPTTWGFVMVDEINGEVVGYIVGSKV
jgi:hypothetical protein